MIIFLACAVLLLCVACIPVLRRTFFTQLIYPIAKKSATKISTLERQAAEAGTQGFDAEFFKGTPNWKRLRLLPGAVLTQEEQQFIAGPARELCAMIDDWDIRGVRRDIPEPIWEFIKKNRFLGLRVSKDEGGLGFSAQAQSIILGMIASRSFDVSIIVGVSNSLGPEELIEQYGTDEQKAKYLRQFRDGSEIPCFAITSPIGGSDVGGMHDAGRITRGTFEGKKVLGISLTWSKRYITLAPKATVISLAIRVTDPDHLLGETGDRGISLVLIPATYKGVHIGRRHLPSGMAFPNGPTWGTDVFIPTSFVIGGESQIGNGWKHIMQCLAAGRGVSLPSMSAAGIKLMLRTSTAYARVRRQFGKSIGRMEGVQEALLRLVEAAYITESARAVTSAMVSSTERPLVIASIMKYQLTEYARKAVNDAMDIHAGKGIIDGPSNYLQSAYQIAPIGITVEGANILTRSLMIIGQAVLRSHPFFNRELQALNEADVRKGLRDFDTVLVEHVAALIRNGVLAFMHNVTFGIFANNGSGPTETRKWHQQLSRASRTFAFVADVTIVFYQGALKKRQRMSGRLADALSELYLMACTLKRFEDDGAPRQDYPVVELALRNGLHRFDTAVASLIRNIPILPLRLVLRLAAQPFGMTYRSASDALGSKVVRLALEPGEVRDRLTRYVYIPDKSDEPLAVLERAMQLSSDNEPLIEKFEKMMRSEKISMLHKGGPLADALERHLLTDEEVAKLRELEVLVEKVTAVDHFDPADVADTASHR